MNVGSVGCVMIVDYFNCLFNVWFLIEYVVDFVFVNLYCFVKVELMKKRWY